MKKQSFIITSAVLASVCGCSSAQPPAAPELNTVVVAIDENAVPGTVDHLWVEPMIGEIRIPGQLDPNGIYYRLPHTTYVEGRPHKFQVRQFPPATDKP